jgi:hypothetical protein
LSDTDPSPGGSAAGAASSHRATATIGLMSRPAPARLRGEPHFGTIENAQPDRDDVAVRGRP